jgi:hypothetical protein
MIKNEPMTVCSKNRLYTTRRIRKRLNLLNVKYGRGTPVQVTLMDVDRSPEWGVETQVANFNASLGYYGEVHIPQGAMDDLALAEDDTLRVNMQALR